MCLDICTYIINSHPYCICCSNGLVRGLCSKTVIKHDYCLNLKCPLQISCIQRWGFGSCLDQEGTLSTVDSSTDEITAYLLLRGVVFSEVVHLFRGSPGGRIYFCFQPFSLSGSLMPWARLPYCFLSWNWPTMD